MGIGNIRDRFPAPWLKTAVASPTSSGRRPPPSRAFSNLEIGSRRASVPVRALGSWLRARPVFIGTALFVLPHLLPTSTASSTSVPRRPTSGAGASPPAACPA
eukprot:scaffold34283_cov30-Phaeocystis_antarctica.AAC.1